MGDIRPIREVAEYVKKLLPDASIELMPGNLGLGWKYDTSPVEQEIGYSSQWPMERGIRDTINMLRQQHGLPRL